ncbi:GNAT family N-acetyltransferase [Sphingopyxis sp. FD7]|jgi:RimJ/RimL family protein N-acetyltransferase|uniref:GNAT family N-acetyltransferase n=1 Tax=Sphingopyxis sp. FD7 TaxID=1914525 RepID=UPI000DC63B94|nr:GNAT family N-acetyltransferase [Sphingopyxis sp. FD7]BBB12386.1 acetyltransferase [Sphingopyxis sp. FD7]
MLNGPLLVTERLILRPPAAEDFDAFAAMCAEEETMRFIGGVCPRSAAWRQWCTLAGAWHIRGFSMFSVIERASGEWVGRLGPWEPDGWPAPEIGYGVRAKFAGKGYAFEGCIAACDFAVEFLKWPELMHSIDPANTRSQALATRLGARNSGPTRLPAPFEDAPVDAWTQSADAWRSKRKEFRP